MTAAVYWSEVSTLVTPDMWNFIGTTAPVNVPQGDTLAVAGPLTWPESDIPATGHYCFVAILDHPQDEAPPIPGPLDWDDFRALIRNHNNATWRNFNVVDDIPDPSADPAELRFLIAGAPDWARHFDLETIQRLPREAEIWLKVPLALAGKLTESRLWPARIDRKRQVVRLCLPSQPRIRLCWVRLGAGSRHSSRFLVRGVKGMEQGGHSIAIRQLFEGEEVGRVTWHFHRRRNGEGKDSQAPLVLPVPRTG